MVGGEAAVMELIEIRDLEDAYILCRTLGHSWDDNPTAELDSELWQSSVGALALRCTRCTTERFDFIGNDLGVFYRYYRYPSHYKSVPGQGTRPNLRGEMLRRSLLIRKYNGRAPRKSTLTRKSASSAKR